MKKYVFLFFVIMFTVLICLSPNIAGTDGITYYCRDAITIENTENIKIMYYEIQINTENSTIEENILLNNITNQEVITEIRLPLESPELGISISDLSIIVNGYKIKNYPRIDNKEYVFKIKINPNEGKRIEFSYRLDSDLRNAKVIKYNFHNLKSLNKAIGKIKCDISFPEEDLPLVTGIYPMHYTYDNNIVSIEYYNVSINTLTENIIVSKDTYNDLLYNRDSEELPNGIYNFLKKAPDYIENGIEFNYGTNNNYYDLEGQILDLYDLRTKKVYDRVNGFGETVTEEYFDYISLPKPVGNLITYILFKQTLKDDKKEFWGSNEYYGDVFSHMNLPDLLYRIISKEGEDISVTLKGKTICVEFVETEDDKELYIEKREEIRSGNEYNEATYQNKLILSNERDILKTKVYSNAYAGKRRR